ncbi:hypothetical protein JAAARDRAFT_45655 [Jaapia argillacea MUCL 33604]|uniref:Uncharacterized protein n=1 Tax=Jaapia argillacea MUCL 33604 TaxID=933084 RepID=A0A067Q491_9AGAM|nr:hypothetical protein JAAARDRAFT_45655 [Jaapia argillacea MUCL 33604]
MFHPPQHRLDTPPPTSQFHRPWSPDPTDPLPSLSRYNLPPQGQGYDYDYVYDHDDYTYHHPQHRQQRREPSDVSVEALDLADYAMTLDHRQHQQLQPHYAPFRPPEYPPSPPALRPLASPDSIQVPSLVSDPTGSSSSHTTHSFASHSGQSRGRGTPRRPFSLPPPRSHNSFSPSPHLEPQYTYDYPHSSNHDYPGVPIGGRFPPNPPDEIDISQFPAWSRKWYHPQNTLNPIPQNPPKRRVPEDDLSPFDPSFPTHKYHSTPYDPQVLPYSGYSLPSSSVPSHSAASRDALPWSSDPPDYPLDSEIKEERMRMLEREFGGKGSRSKEEFGEEGVVGSVDGKGNLVTEGPKKRMVVRGCQILLALAGSIAAIYGGFVRLPSSLISSQNKH